MSRILKALATIESKGATLTLPREALPHRPKRREDGPRAELTLASLEAYLQAALAADAPTTFGGEVTDAVALCCAPGLAGPWIEPVASIDLYFEPTDASSISWAARDSGPRPLAALVDREIECEPLVDVVIEEALESDLLSSQDILLTPEDEVVAQSAIELLDWDAAYDNLAPPAPEHVQAEAIAEVVVELIEDFAPIDLDAFRLDAAEDLSAWTDCAEAFPAAAESIATVAPSDLPGWPDDLPEVAVVVEDETEVDLDTVFLDVAPDDHAWLAEFESLPAEPQSQLAVECPDWATVDAAALALALRPEEVVVIEIDEAPARAIEPPPVLRRRATSRDLLPADEAWHECRAIANSLLDPWNGAAAAWLFVELGGDARSTPIVAPLAAMVAESISGRVLLVDADCRPAHDLQALRDVPPLGFADIVRRPARWLNYVHHSAVSRLDLIPSGQRDSVAEASQEEFAAEAWLSNLRRAYDVTLLHATWPSAGALAQLAAAATATYLVARLGNLDETTAQAAMAQLQAWGARVEGCIVTE
jgi:Mrp family chromosome partitioning ATPase